MFGLARCIFVGMMIGASVPAIADELTPRIDAGIFFKDGNCNDEESLRLSERTISGGSGFFICELFDVHVSEIEPVTAFARVMCNLGDVDERVIDDIVMVARTENWIDVSARNDYLPEEYGLSLGLSGQYMLCED